MSLYYYNPPTKLCPVCGKMFICPNSRHWVYQLKQNKSLFFCSWTCIRAWERNNSKSKEVNTWVSQF